MSGRTAEQIAEAFAAEFLPTGDPGYVNEEGQPPNNGTPMPRGPEDYGLPAIDESDESTAESGARTPRKLRFPLVPFDQIAVDTERRGYLVKGLLASTGLAVIWGPPKCGKSFWAVDVGLHISLGWEYRGRRVQQATVVYIALEGQHGLPARIEAFKRHHGVRSAPFYLILVRLNLIADAGALVEEIKAQLGEELPGIVFIDTLNRSLVGSESKDEDMGKYLSAADKVATDLSCAVGIVHHCGIDDSRPRGHTSLTGSVESQLACKRGAAGEVVVTVEFAKDMPEGAEVVSRLAPMVVGTDPDGDEITTLVVVPAEAANISVKPQRIAPQTMKFLDALLNALAGDEAVARGQGKACSTACWKSECVRMGLIDPAAKPESARSLFNANRRKLIAANRICCEGDLSWPIK